MTMTTFLIEIERHGARLVLDGVRVRVDSVERLPAALLALARENRELIRRYLELTGSAIALGKFIDSDPAKGIRLPEFETPYGQIIELEKKEILCG